ncbi:P protein, putative [Acanthamoeba castellanii str. Neff]|uniref:P protein, putative n=1 Tax=Acanthamoeba castellanii (strain ATCC 30010 / Neff) TaxID=1257118 RepID=L8GMI1_ACACF|nr:P protein, putative [Acanthamoeba castellanii str. Neff]ELR13426.1 P protein, putative [Acanthamoeba castellanii str. Neff]
MGDTEKRSFGQTNVKGYGATSAPYHDMEDVEYNDDHSRHGDEERGMSSSGDRTRNTNSVDEYRGRQRPEDADGENWFLFDKEGKQMGVLPNKYKREFSDAKHKVTGLPWHHIKVAVISLLFVVALIMFAPIESPDESPVSHLTAVSHDTAYIVDLLPSHPLDTIKVFVTIQELVNSSGSVFPNPTYVYFTVEGLIPGNGANSTDHDDDDDDDHHAVSGMSGGSSTELETPLYPDGEWKALHYWEIAGDAFDAQMDSHYFYLTDEDRGDHYALRLNVTSNSKQPVGLKLKVLQLRHIVRYEVILGLVLLVLVYVLIVFELVHRTIAALVGSFWGLTFLAVIQERPSFLEVIMWIDYDTIGLLFGMMILVGIFSTTGFFEYSAVKAYKLSKGNIWNLVLMLCMFTAVTSAFLDNVTTILLVAPVTLRLCKVINLDPLPVILAEVIFSNIGGTATGIGDPPNILIISNAKMRASKKVDFATFTVHVAPGAVLALIVTVWFVKVKYGKILSERSAFNPLQREIDIWKRTAARISPVEGDEEKKVRTALEDYVEQLNEKLAHGAVTENKEIDITEMEEKYKITDMPLFIKTCSVLAVVIILFFIHPFVHAINLSLPWIALTGAMALLVLSGIHEIQEIIEKVEMATLLFFAGLFVLMRCIEEMGVMLYIADLTADLIAVVPEGRLRLGVACVMLVWVCAIVSAFIDNIPFTTTMIPIVVKLSQSGLGLPLQPITWSLALGACLGGNGTLIGASANVVAAGIAEQQGYPISFNYFFKMGFPCMLVSTAVATVYILISHVIIPWY